MLRTVCAIAAIGTVMMMSDDPLPAQGLPQSCVTSPDSADQVRLHFHDLVTKADSAGLARLRLPYRPAAGISVVTDEETCQIAINAFNDLYQDDSTNFISRAVVIRVGADRYVVWGVRPRSGKGRDLYFVFDQAFNFLKLLT
jgi:hypothetical protein